jgi:peptidoglycan/xylan/chitin deacetylase (PgdA/CDA1 family)
MRIDSNKILTIITIIQFQILFSCGVNGQVLVEDSADWGKLYVTTWADDRKSAFSFSFDDGFISQYENVKSIFDTYNFKSTFFILPPFLTDTLPGFWRYGTWQMFYQMAVEGYELGSHTLNHYDLTQLPPGDTLTPNTINYELYHSKKMIEARFPYARCISFAYPFAEHNPLVDSLAGLYYESARVVGGITNPKSLTPDEWLSLKSYQVEFDFPRDSLENDLDELYDLLDWIQSSISAGTWGIQLAHEVVPFEELADLINQGAYHPVSNEWLLLLCDWLYTKSESKEVWIETIGSITKYIKERQSASYRIISKSNSLVEIELSDTLINYIYNFPLSAYISVPDNWEYVLVNQNFLSQIIESIHSDSMQVVLAKLIPDGGIINLTEYNPNYVSELEHSTDGFILKQNYPNPFNPVTEIKFHLPEKSNIAIKVYDILGNEISVLAKGESEMGDHSVLFDGKSLPSGIYIYTLQAGKNIYSKKMVLLR